MQNREDDEDGAHGKRNEQARTQAIRQSNELIASDRSPERSVNKFLSSPNLIPNFASNFSLISDENTPQSLHQMHYKISMRSINNSRQLETPVHRSHLNDPIHFQQNPSGYCYEEIGSQGALNEHF